MEFELLKSAVAKNRVEIRDMIIEILQGEQVQWCTLEFQGEVLAEENETLDGYELGNCVVDGDKVSMEIGQHFMEGKLVDLDEPFLVMRNVDGQMSTCGFVEKKLVFKTRPQPIVKKLRSR